ncbi:uncharacterized protein LOC106665181 [Cimex lectularius]|uniref:Uncharacterized protein n=1 Tax=Cimex lectularius TaxID=79782 RepID=A0A8I6RKY8_CIMLE|nr:uncharacterized protein LOC106665181 [Cimex lectularius]
MVLRRRQTPERHENRENPTTKLKSFALCRESCPEDFLQQPVEALLKRKCNAGPLLSGTTFTSSSFQPSRTGFLQMLNPSPFHLQPDLRSLGHSRLLTVLCWLLQSDLRPHRLLDQHSNIMVSFLRIVS